MAVAEAYPELKANQNFLALQNELAELEDQFQMARRYYNGTVRDYNISIQSFPDVLVARLTGFHEEHFFEAEAPKRRPSAGSFPGGRHEHAHPLALRCFRAVAAEPARAMERIERFVSDVDVQRNGDLWSPRPSGRRGRQIKRGILRDFPTTYRRADGSRVEVGFDVPR